MGCPPHLLSDHMQRESMGGSQGFVLQEYYGCMWGKGVWKWVKAKTSSETNNNASEGVDENVWKVQAVTKQNSALEKNWAKRRKEVSLPSNSLFVCSSL
jgi:hypothetical protein